MKKLYDKIYNAVNEGIQKALINDLGQNDVSINYTYHKVNNNIDKQSLFETMFNKAVNDFIKTGHVDSYNNILLSIQYGECI